MTSGSNSCSVKGEFIFCSSFSRASTSICGALVSSTSNSKRPPRVSLSTRCRICAWLPRQNFTVTPYRRLKPATSLSWSSCVRDEYSISSPSFFAPAIRRAVRSGPEYAATAATPGVGSTPNAGSARRTLKTKQVSRIFAQDLVLLPGGEILALADAGDRVRVLRVEVRIVARHEDAVLAELPDRPLEIGLVRLAGDPAVAP